MTKVGFIFECGGPDSNREGPDVQVITHLVKKLNPGVEMLSRFSAGKHNLLKECGRVAKLLVKEEQCACVFIIWDLYPAWRNDGAKPCKEKDCCAILESIKAAGITASRVKLICIQEELEAWLLADHNAVRLILEQYKHPHPLTRRIPQWKKPDEVSNPKTVLTRLFIEELGRSKRYTDYQHALPIIKGAKLEKLLSSKSYSQFKTLLTAV